MDLPEPTLSDVCDSEALARRIEANHRTARAEAKTLAGVSRVDTQTVLIRGKPSRGAPAKRTKEARCSPRASLFAAIDLSSETNFFRGRSTDIAHGGLFIATANLLRLGSRLQVRFTLPGHGELEAEVEVRWLRAFDEQTGGLRPGMGVKFVDLSQKAFDAITAFVAERQPIFHPD